MTATDAPPYAADTDDGWPDPIPLADNATLPAFPLDDAPVIFRAMVEGVARSAQVDPALPALIAVAVLGTACQGRVRVRVTEEWVEPVAIYAAPVAEPGNLKTAVIGRLVHPLDVIGAELTGIYQDALQTALRAQEAAKDARDDARKAARSGAGSREAYDAAAAAYDAVVIPTEPLLYVTDATPEALVKYLDQNEERLAAFSDEGGGLITMAGVRYAAAPNLDPMLKSWSAAASRSVRVGTDRVSLAAPILNVGVLAQPEALRTLASVPGAGGLGLLDRFLLAAPADLLGRRDVDPPPIALDVVAGWEEAVVRLTRVTRALGTPELLDLTPDARAELQAWRRDVVEPGMVDDGDWHRHGLRGYAAKLHGHAVRLAAVHHAARFPVGTDPRDRPWHRPVEAVSMRWGIEVAAWSVPHHRFALADAGTDATTAETARVLRWVQDVKRRHAEDRETVSVRAASRGTGLDKAAAGRAFEALTDAGWLRRVVEADGERRPGRPAAPRWEVHPSCR